jgi:flavin reductase ActVB
VDVPEGGRRAFVYGYAMAGYESGRLREVMGRFPTGVTVVTACHPDGGWCGLTVNSFSSLSLDPPLVLVCIDTGAKSHRTLIEAGSFTVNVLAADHAALAERFASDPQEGRFQSGSWAEGPEGGPVLEDAAAWMRCTLQEVLPGGDHSILVGRVIETGVGGDEPLLFHRGRYGRVAP